MPGIDNQIMIQLKDAFLVKRQLEMDIGDN